LNVPKAVAAFERHLIREWVNRGLAAAKASGVKLGRPGMESARPSDQNAQEAGIGRAGDCARVEAAAKIGL
jgi:DNA invertase Pin-like site-specific DNA recombinase